MAWENTAFVIAAFIAGGITSSLALVAFQRRFVPGAVQFGLFMLACAIWSFAYAIELGSPALNIKLFWINIEYIGIAWVPLAWLIFILYYTGREAWLSRARLAGLCLPPVALLLLVLTNPAHQLVWDKAELISTGRFSFVLIEHTAGLYAFVIYSNVLLLVGTVLVLRMAVEVSRYYRKQAILVVVATLVSWIGNIVYVGNLNPVPGLDWTPFGFAITGLVFGLALFRYHLLDILPVARHAILEGMLEGVLVLDERNRILDCNPAAARLLGLQIATVLGRQLDELRPELGQLPDWFANALDGELEIALLGEGSQKIVEFRASRLVPEHTTPTGYLVILRDVTRARLAERSLFESEERFRRLAEASLEGIILSDNLIIRDLNPQMQEMLGYSNHGQEIIGWNLLDIISPEDQPQVRQAIENGHENPYKLHLLHRDGSLIPVEFRGKLFQLEGRPLRVTAVQDLSAQVRFQESLQRREAILDAVSYVAGALLKDPDWEVVIQDVLSRLGQSAQASRAYVFQAEQNGGRGLLFNQRFEWVNQGISAQIDNPDLQGFSFQDANFPTWEVGLLEGKSISGLVRDMPESMADFLSAEDILALAIVPIFASRHLWGFLGFDECETERNWSEGEIEALEAAANTIGAAIQRQEIESALRSSEQRYRAIVQAARDVIFSLTPKGRISSLNPAFEETTGWRVSDWLGKSFIGLIHPSDLSIAKKVIYQVNEGDLLPVFEARVRTASGAVVIMEFKAVAEREAGKLKEIRGVARDITARYHAERSLQQRMEELAALYETSLEINAQRDLSNLLQAIIERACRLTQAPLGGIFLLSPSTLQLTLEVSHHLPARYLGMVLEKDEGVAGQVLATRNLLMVPDMSDWEGRAEKFDPVKFGRALGVPLKISERVIGVIMVGDDRQTGSYSRAEIQLVSLFADQAAIAIENVRLMEAEHQRVEELDGLRATMAEISLELDLNTLLRTALERAVKLTGATGGELGLYIEGDHQIEVVASYNMGKVMTGVRFAIGEGAMGQAAERREPIAIMDYADWAGRSPKYEGAPIYAALAIPLMVGGRMVGVIGVFHSDKIYSFTETELNLLSLFGQQAAIAVENARLFSETRRLAQIDSLTGLFNRRHFYELARREFERSRRYQQPLSAIMIDVDSFKHVNDRYGHSVGDMVLHSVAQSCMSYLRTTDLVARYGGEEFVALIPNTDLDGCRITAERMRICVEGRSHLVGEDHLKITISLGIAEMEPGCLNIDTLLDQADKALYLAKQGGKNRVAVWPKETFPTGSR